MQQFSSCLAKAEPFSACIKAAAGSSELRIPLPSFGPDLSLMISRGSALDGPSIYAWLHSSHATRIASAALATFEASLADCHVEYDGFGGEPLIRIGSATFRVEEQYAAALELRFAFPTQDWHD
jgi:hypothetical protein